ncbi:hypothetical protein H0H93_010725 [Arthromyces matolae]|nr:hypothetical protein H0H93_010725 [Arthromyces matolae]
MVGGIVDSTSGNADNQSESALSVPHSIHSNSDPLLRPPDPKCVKIVHPQHIDFNKFADPPQEGYPIRAL